METKLCKACNTLQDKSQYIRCAFALDGLQTKCKDCVKNEKEIWKKLVVNCEFCRIMIKFNLLKRHVKKYHWLNLQNKE